METDWQVGTPPFLIELDVFAFDCVRRGYSDGNYFHFVDCIHPMQNSVTDLDRVTHWRSRNPVQYPFDRGQFNSF